MTSLLPQTSPNSPPDSPKKFKFKFSLGKEKWVCLKKLYGLQFFDAMTAGAREEEDEEWSPSAVDLIFHFLSFYWKLTFAFIPPPSLWGGWPAFLSCLFLMGGITILLEEFALLFSCTSGINPFVTAVTFVAIGTSLPELLASKIATQHSSDADSALANIVGSNSVNVFLGIGLPWLITSIYNKISTGNGMEIKETNLYVVSLYTYFVGFGLVVSILLLRRFYIGGELGGPRKWQVATFLLLVILWVVFILMSIIKASEFF